MARIKFEELSKAEQRVVIAKDLLLRLRTKRFTAKESVYLIARKVAQREGDARKALRRAECLGCQIGGLFLCALDRHNKLELRELEVFRDGRDTHVREWSMRTYLSQWFSYRELLTLENYFEGWDKVANRRFTELMPAPADRMRMIAQNIVDGNGRFSARRLMQTARQRS